MTNNYFATALISADCVGLTVRAEDIGTAFELAENCLRERYPQSEVIVQAVQCSFNEFGSNSTARDLSTKA